MFDYLADLAQSIGTHRVVLPAWLGRALHKAQAAKIAKGASHKYIRKIPTGKTSKTGKPLFRYFYTVGGGAGLGHHSEFVEGAAFRVKDAGKEGHFHIVRMPHDGAEGITIRHDESGKTSTITRAALRELLHNEHAEPLRQAKQRAAATLEQAKKTGTPKQQERARQQAQKVGAKEKGGVGAFEFDRANAADFEGLWGRSQDPSATKAQAVGDYNKHLQAVAQSLHEIAPNDPRAVEAFDAHKKSFDAAFQRWAQKNGALAEAGYKRGGVEASLYDTAHMKDQAYKATAQLLESKEEGRKLAKRFKSQPQSEDPVQVLHNKIKDTQARIDKMERLNAILSASPKGWVPAKMQFIDKLNLDKDDLRDYGKTGVPAKTLSYLKQTIKTAERKLDDIEEDEKRRQREAEREKVGAEQAKPKSVEAKEINAALKADPVAALKKHGQDLAGRMLRVNLTMVDPDSWGARGGAKIKTNKRDLLVLGASPEGLRVLVAERKRKDPAPYESSYHYDNLTLPWDRLSLEDPSLEAKGADWREVQDRIKVASASVDESPPAHTLGIAAISAATEKIADPKERAMLWEGVASPQDAALLASDPQGVSDAAFNIYRHLRDAGDVDTLRSPGTARLSAGGRSLEQANRDEAAILAQLIRTKSPRSASVEAAAQAALGLKDTSLYLVNTERMQREILRQQAQESRASVTKSLAALFGI